MNTEKNIRDNFFCLLTTEVLIDMSEDENMTVLQSEIDAAGSWGLQLLTYPDEGFKSRAMLAQSVALLASLHIYNAEPSEERDEAWRDLIGDDTPLTAEAVIEHLNAVSRAFGFEMTQEDKDRNDPTRGVVDLAYEGRMGRSNRIHALNVHNAMAWHEQKYRREVEEQEVDGETQSAA